jgi:hypothetical protein
LGRLVQPAAVAKLTGSGGAGRVHVTLTQVKVNSVYGCVAARWRDAYGVVNIGRRGPSRAVFGVVSRCSREMGTASLTAY